MKKHGDRKHALLSASGSSRWMACPPSARLEDEHGTKDETSDYADEGELAHELSELDLLRELNRITPKDYADRRGEKEKHRLYSVDMEEPVGEYVDEIMETFNALKVQGKSPEILIEEKIDLSEVIPEGFGSNDALIICDGSIYVFDLKFGRGVKVYADKNPQLKLYAFGALVKFELDYEIRTVHLCIVQPRVENSNRSVINAGDLRDWAYGEVAEKAALAFKGEGDQQAGDHCQFCRVSGRCRAFNEKALEVAKHDFEDPKLLDDEELLDIFAQVDFVKRWAEKVKSYVLKTALDGKDWPGHKLVNGQSRRKIEDPDPVIKKLKSMKFRKGDYIRESLVGIGDLEKLVGKEKFTENLAPFVSKPPGAPVLVELSDPRPAIDKTSSAAEDFKD